MAEETNILYVDLYDNVLTEKKGDYMGKVAITGSLRNADIARRIVEKRTEYRPETIQNILDLADEEKIIALTEGKSCVDGVGQLLLRVTGSFDGEQAPFDPEKHSLDVSFTRGKALRERLAKVNGVDSAYGRVTKRSERERHAASRVRQGLDAAQNCPRTEKSREKTKFPLKTGVGPKETALHKGDGVGRTKGKARSCGKRLQRRVGKKSHDRIGGVVKEPGSIGING